MLLKIAADEQAKENIRDLTVEQIRSRAVEAVQNLYGSIFAILHSDKSAEQKRAEMQKVFKKLTESDVNNPLMNVSNDLEKEIDSIIMNSEITNEQKLAEIQKMINESTDADAIELLKSVSKTLKIMIAIETIIKSEMTDKQKQAEIQKLYKEIQMTEAEIEVWITAVFDGLGNVVDSRFQSQVEHTAHVNGTKAAVEVYRVAAKTGKLPEKLPEGLPKDPYSGEDFEYEITEDGFVLRCRVQPVNERQVRQYEFKVQK